MPQGGVGGEDGVLGHTYSCGNLGGWVNGEPQLGILTIIKREGAPISKEVNPEPVPQPKLLKTKKP